MLLNNGDFVKEDVFTSKIVIFIVTMDNEYLYANFF